MIKNILTAMLLLVATTVGATERSFIVPSPLYMIGTLTPTSTAINAPFGTMYISNSSSLFIKLDDYLSTNWLSVGGGSGISSLNGLTGSSQTFSTGNSGTDFGISSAGSVHTFNIPTASASNRGLLSSADWTKFNGVVGVPAATVSYWVDGARTDSYTADGSFAHPYKTIQAGVNRIISNGDNADDKPYQLLVMGPEFYPENVDIGNVKITDFYMDCVGAPQSCVINPASGNSFQSTANNDLQHIVILKGFDMVQGFTMTNPGGQHFLESAGQCYSCVYEGPITITGAGAYTIGDADYSGDFTFDSSTVFINDSSGTSNMTVQNGAVVVADDATITGNITLDATSTMITRGGSRIGADSGSLTNAGTLQLYSSFVRSHITNSGTLNVRGGNYRANTLTNTGTITREVPLENFGSFTSGSVTCTGSSQNVAHGLGYVPAHVLISAQDDTAAQVTGYVITEGSHTSTNVVLTCTSGVKVKVMAF